MSTRENLDEAFAGESMANRKYLAFAIKAAEEGLGQVAKLFRAAAEAETVHALNHLKVMGGIGTSKDNLEMAIVGETSEFEEMYPEFIKEAEAAQETDARVSFWRANEVEKIHAKLAEKALADLGHNEEADYYVCQVCGNTVEHEAPDTCPICGRPKEQFKLIV